MLARREIKKKTEAASSVREFQEKFRIPEGVDVTKLSSEISGDGVLIITGQKRDHLGITLFVIREKVNIILNVKIRM